MNLFIVSCYYKLDSLNTILVRRKRPKSKKTKKQKSRARGCNLVSLLRLVFAWNFHVSLTKTAAVVLVLAHNCGAHVQTSIGVDAGGLSDILQEGVGARLVRETHVPHQVLLGDVSAVQADPMTVHLAHADPHVGMVGVLIG